MKGKIKELLGKTKDLTSLPETRQAVIALLRITLQHACITVAEWVVNYSRNQRSGNFSSDLSFLEDLRDPSDGTLVSSLANLLIAAENLGWRGVSQSFWEKIESGRPCYRISNSKSANLETVLQGFVSLRNNSVEGHGIPGEYDIEAEIDVVAISVEKLEHILPDIQEGERLGLKNVDGQVFVLQMLRMYDNDLICYRSIKKTSGGRCIVSAQRQLSLFEREDVSFDAIDMLTVMDNVISSQYVFSSTYIEDWAPLLQIPDRITDLFIGRRKELEMLTEWVDDLDSRACLLFGDGGIGKTTLVVEFVHKIISGEIKISWKPKMISFYTAKQTRWGIDGLEVIRSQPATITDAVLEIVRGLEGKPLERKWFTKTPQIIQQLSSYLREWDIDRDSHLLILDNTETMVKTSDQVDQLAKHVKELSRRVGRVILTSRRRETLEAYPIEIKPFTVDESVDFLKKRAFILKRQPVLQAGIPRLMQLSNKLGNKPLVLEVFIQALGMSESSLDKAFDRVLRMQRQDLGEFLYYDAWQRMSESLRILLLLMTRVADIHDELLLKLSCMQAGVSVLEASDALEESSGIANTFRFGGKLQINFSPDFLEFCKDRHISINGVQHPTAAAVDTVRRRYNEFLRSSNSKINDRVSKAFRHPLARAAWISYQGDRFEDAEVFYEEAVLADSENGLLHDRYAYFLFKIGRLEEALDKAVTATRFATNDAEVWFTRGLIEARRSMVEQAVSSLNRAQNLGKPEHMCLLQKAYAHYYDNPPDRAKARASLDESERKTPKDHPYRWQHMEELRKLRAKLD